MKLPTPLKKARLIKRYKRFLCDVRLEDGSEITAHIADPGRLTDLAIPDAALWLSSSDNPKRKLGHSVEMIEQNGALVGVRPARANDLVHEALLAGKIASLEGAATILPEYRLNPRTRLDFKLVSNSGEAIFIEVKSASWRRDDLACFPDAPTARGRKHLEELGYLADAGHRALILFVAQRSDVAGFSVAGDIDPGYAAAFAAALKAGVESRCYQCSINFNEILLNDIIA